MKIKVFLMLLMMCTSVFLFAQNQKTDSIKSVKLNEVIITTNRLPIMLKNNPGSVSLVNSDMLSSMPKAVAAEEALRLVPGVRIDNQHNGERVHMSIRGQGILTERGLRGIGVMIDGIPVNDPSGFAPDLYDVEWGSINNVEVLRGPIGSLYGGSGSAGLVNITTNDGGPKTLGGEISQTIGTHAFSKSLVQFDGSLKNLDYRLTYSHTSGDGYRAHQAFWGDKLYEKINLHPTKKLKVTQIMSLLNYFHQNPEGLNLGQFSDLSQANPDACPFNEYQKTSRNTFALLASYQFNDKNDVQLSGFYRSWNYKETSNKCAEYRTVVAPGASVQYNLHLGKEKFKNHISLGADLKWQDIDMHKLQSLSNPNRIESTDETNLVSNNLLANQTIAQSSMGVFALYKLEISHLNVMASLRYDQMKNELTDKMMASDTAKTSKDFTKTSAHIGASYSFCAAATLFANYSQGFVPPSTEELASNPVGYSGFNTHLLPATSTSIEFGLRGFFSDKLYYELTGFLMNTENDFFRFKQLGRGNQEVFYGNAGNSQRNGVELFVSYKICKNFSFQLAYTFADYKYTTASIDPVYLDTAYVLTNPPAKGQWLPNSPKHQLYAEVVYSFCKGFKLSLGTEYQSKWAIYTDAKAYSGEMNPSIYQNWEKGFNLYHARLSYEWKLEDLNVECSLYVRNLTNKTFMAFTEPDPDGNSYQPGPGREVFANLKIRF